MGACADTWPMPWTPTLRLASCMPISTGCHRICAAATVTTQGELMTQQLRPERSEPYPGHMCRCVVVYSPGGRPDKCHAMIYVPDQPICDHCTQMRHREISHAC